MSKEKKEVKKITVGLIFSWIFGVLFLLAGTGTVATSPIPGIIIILCSAMIIPYFNKLIAEKLNFEISGGIKFVLVIIIFVAIGFAASNDIASTDTTQQANTENNQQLEETTTPSANEEVNQEPVLSEPEVYYAGDRVEVGNFAYTINSYYTTDKIGQDLAGTFMGEKADGIFLVLDVTIENIAKESKTMWGSYIKVIDDQERTFEHDTTAEIYLDESFSFEQMQPGLPKTGKVVFDVPKDLKGMLGISSDSMWSDEVKYVSWNKKE